MADPVKAPTSSIASTQVVEPTIEDRLAILESQVKAMMGDVVQSKDALDRIDVLEKTLDTVTVSKIRS
jgi:hypothetical protein